MFARRQIVIGALALIDRGTTLPLGAHPLELSTNLSISRFTRPVSCYQKIAML